MTREEALKKEEDINVQIVLLQQARAHYSLIASGIIETPEEINAQAAKGEALTSKVDMEVIKGEEIIKGAQSLTK